MEKTLGVDDSLGTIEVAISDVASAYDYNPLSGA
jgi:hypothetical protein